MLHANWSEGRLHLWGESPERYLEHRRDDGGARVATVADKSLPHPFCAPADEVATAIRQLADSEFAGTSDTVTLSLPTLDGPPAPSDNMAALVDLADEALPGAVANWVVPTASLDPAAAFDLLITLSYRMRANGVEPGPGLRYLCDVAGFLAELLADQRFVPSMYQLPLGVLHGTWLPWLDDEPTEEGARQLLLAMPPVMRSSVDSMQHHPWLILADSLKRMGDRVVRRTLLEHEFFDALDGRDSEVDAHVAVLAGLLEANPEVELSAGRATEVFRDLRSWISRLASPRADQPLRLCIRVNEPWLDPGDSAASAQWKLSLHLRTLDEDGEPQGLLDVADVWGGTDHPATGATTDELILREIARGSTLFEPLAAALSGDTPGELLLSTAQAYEFLKDAAPVLDEAGFEVLAPAWWGSSEGRLGVKLLLTSDDEDAEPPVPGSSPGSTGLKLGLQTIVLYEWQVSIGDETLAPDEFHALAEESAPLLYVGGRWIELRRDDVAAVADVLRDGRVGEMSIIEAMQTAYGVHGGTPRLNVVGVEARGWISALLGESPEGQLKFVQQPETLNGELRPYQKGGLSWLVFLDTYGLGGCLADDMGLGKTVQLIALLLHERAEAQDGASPRPTLIVAPMSVISNWQREVEKFACSLKVHVHHGPDRPLAEEFEQLACKNDIVLTTYGLVNRDVETLQRVHWRRVVLDEAQYVKNTPTKQAQAIRSLTTDRRVALTGTPVENRLAELWSIIDFLNPGYLGSLAEFRRRFALPVERHRDAERADALKKLIQPFVLRRLKTDPDVVPDLPDLVQTREYAVLTPEQARLYNEVVNGMLKDVDDAQGIQRRGMVLAGIVKLKQICNHPANLADGATTAQLDVTGDRGGLSGRSGKVKRLLELLDEVVAAGDQALVFTQYRRMGHLLSRIIPHELDAPVQFMHGGVTRPRRQDMIDRFQDKETYTPVFILSLRAGGVGLNLTAANHVIHFDRWWNPAVENQATDRAFRIGQERTVHVHKLICTGTLEEHIDEMIEKKTDLADRIVGSGDSWLTELSTNQLRDLLVLQDTATEVV